MLVVIVTQHLDRNFTLQGGMRANIDLRHSAPCQQRVDVNLAQCLADPTVHVTDYTQSVTFVLIQRHDEFRFSLQFPQGLCRLFLPYNLREHGYHSETQGFSLPRFIDKPVVRELYRRLLAENRFDSWLYEEMLLPGQDWDLEIEKTVESSDAVIVCVSSVSVAKEGYVQRELRRVLDIALEKPEERYLLFL